MYTFFVLFIYDIRGFAACDMSILTIGVTQANYMLHILTDQNSIE